MRYGPIAVFIIAVFVLAAKPLLTGTNRPIENVQVEVVGSVEPKLKIYYTIDGQEKEQVTPLNGCSQPLGKVEYYDFNNDGSDELLTGCVAGAHSYYLAIYTWSAKSRTILPVCLKATTSVRTCEYLTTAPEYLVEDANSDGLLDLRLTQRGNENDSDYYSLYLWDTKALAE